MTQLESGATPVSGATREIAAGTRGERIARLIGGGGLGAFLGVMLGMSGTPVLGSVMAAIVAIAVSMLSASAAARAGLDGKSPDREPPALRRGAMWSAGFGVGAVIGLLGGVYVRANDLLTPSAADVAKDLVAAGLAKERAAEYSVLLKYGLTPKGEVVKPDARLAGILYNADAKVVDLARLDPRQIGTWSGCIAAWRIEGGVYEAVVDGIHAQPQLDDAGRLAALTSIYDNMKKD